MFYRTIFSVARKETNKTILNTYQRGHKGITISVYRTSFTCFYIHTFILSSSNNILRKHTDCTLASSDRIYKKSINNSYYQFLAQSFSIHSQTHKCTMKKCNSRASPRRQIISPFSSHQCSSWSMKSQYNILIVHFTQDKCKTSYSTFLSMKSDYVNVSQAE